MKPSHYADKMLVMELEKSSKTEQKPPNHPAKPDQGSRTGPAGVVPRPPRPKLLFGPLASGRDRFQQRSSRPSPARRRR